MHKLQRIGSLDCTPARAAGKIVDRWTFTEPDPTCKEGCRKLNVDVALMKGDEGLFFEARIDTLEDGIRDANIESLRSTVERALGAMAGMRQGVVWEDWLEVSVVANDEERQGISRMRAGLTIEVRPLKRGLHPETGEAYTLTANGLWAIKFPEPCASSGSVERRSADESGWVLDSDKEVAYVPDTVANRAALADIRERLRMLRARMSLALRDGAIQETLEDVAGKLQLLAAPEPRG